MSERQKTRVLWLTNLPAPYRFPVWDRMAKEVELKVVFLLKRRNWRNWPEPRGKNWKHEYLSFNSWRISEYDIIPSFRGARKMLQDVDVAIIGGWESPMFIRSILLAKKKKIKVIQFYESFSGTHRFRTGIIDWIRRWIFRKVDEFLVFSRETSLLLNRYGIESTKITELFNPIDVHWFHRIAVENRTESDAGHRYLYVGQLIDRKNIDKIIAAFAAARRQGDKLTIAGDGPLQQKLKDFVEYRGLTTCVQFIGAKSSKDIALQYAINDTLILASKNEVWGLVVNEALASGMHVVVSENCGVTNFVKDMKGVYISTLQLESLIGQLRKSADFWKGQISQPEILKYSTEFFAELVIECLFKSGIKSEGRN